MFLKQIALISASTLFILSCARLGEAKSLTSAQEAVATQLIIPTDATKPGMGQDGGPLTWSFWVKNRQASAELMLGSFTPFYKINTLRRAVSQHFVLYADTASAALVSSSVNRIAVLTSGSTTVTGLSATGDLAVGMRVTGGGLPCATYIASITNSAVVEITNPAPTSGTPTLTFARGPSVILDSMECAYSNLLHVYGGDKHPYANNNARIVILAYDILDDYATTGGYVGGYFAPRDLYSNAFTTSLFTNPAAIQQNAQLVGQLGGYSNEMSVVYYDLNPGYTTAPNQVNDIVLHELSHLFTYNYRVIQQRYKNLDLWIAEGVAENAPHQTNGSGNLLTLRLSQMGSPALFASYQAAPQLVDFQTWGPKIVGYLQSNLFFSYLRHRLELNSTGSAASFVHDAVTQIDTSMNGINALISTYLPSENFSTIYQDFVTTHYLMLLGIQIEDTNGMNGGGINLQQKYSFCKSEIGISNTGVNNCTSIKARYSSNIPFNYDAPRCSDNTYGLKPNSYIIYRHKVAGDRTHFDIPGTDPVAGELPLKIIINTTPEATLISGPPATVNLYTYNAGDNIPFTSSLGFVNGDIAQIIVVNPNPTGSCRKLDETWLLKRNHSKWVGQNSFGVHASPDFYWQSDAGASWLTDTDGAYYRPAGLAADLQGYPNNRLYISDYINMSVQRLNLDTGEPLGRLGSPSNTCPTTGMPWSTSTNRYLNGYCAHNFNSPQGLAVDKDHNLYVADTDNSRIVRYDAAGNFTGWLGLNGDEAWQTAGFVSSGTLVSAGAETNPRMFRTPYAVAVNPDDASQTYLYVVDYGGKRISRRNRLTGAYGGFIGNGENAWNTTATTQSPAYGHTAGYLGYGSIGPRGVAIANGKLYVVDEGNQRIVRIDAASGNFERWLGSGYDDWQVMTTAPSQTGNSAVKYFRYPSAVVTDGTYLYVADRGNNRIVKWRIDGLNCDKPISSGKFCGWIGHGRVGWETTASAPSTNPADDPYVGSYYPSDYYAQPHGLVLVKASQKGTRNNYLFMTSVYNGRVSRINLDCVDTPSGSECDPIYTIP